ncbi:MAG: NERD domain-containing protein, partial [Rhodocyclaceae bacterium]|nr:NERD domain-containing protein [Rhodocyclaceae bacterium]
MASDPRRTPLKSKPLRNPGQSLQQQREELITDKVLWPMMVAVMVIIVAGLEWFRFFHPLPPQPWVMTFIAVLGILYSVWTIKRNAPRIKALKLAEEGEKAVGQYLEKFREFGYQIFHDVMGDDFNVDHVLIGPAGVFTVETKTWKKPAKGSPRISFDGECLKADGIVPSRDPVVQAKAQASWLRA